MMQLMNGIRHWIYSYLVLFAFIIKELQALM
jgi:hypothetical protein